MKVLLHQILVIFLNAAFTWSILLLISIMHLPSDVTPEIFEIIDLVEYFYFYCNITFWCNIFCVITILFFFSSCSSRVLFLHFLILLLLLRTDILAVLANLYMFHLPQQILQDADLPSFPRTS